MAAGGGLFGGGALDPLTAGLFGAGAGILGGQNLQQGLGQGAAGFLQAYNMQNQYAQAAEQAKLEREALELEKQQAEREWAAQQAYQNLFMGGAPSPSQAGGAPPAPAPPGPGPSISAQPVEPVGTPSLAYNAGVSASGSPGAPGAGVGAPSPTPPPTPTGGALSPFQATMESLSPQERAMLMQMDPNQGLSYLGQKTERRITNASGLRKEYMRESADFEDLQTKYSNLRSSLGQGTGAGDVAGIFSLFKILDPTSTVREGEAATLRNATAVPEWIKTMYNRMLVTGEQLGPKQRADIQATADSLFTQARAEQDHRFENYRGIAQTRGYDPEVAVPNLYRELSLPQASTEISDADYKAIMSDVEAELAAEIEAMGGE